METQDNELSSSIKENVSSIRNEKTKKEKCVEQQKVLKYVNSIRQNSDYSVKKGLVGIKSLINEGENALKTFHECGGFTHLIKLLSSSNEQLLGTALHVMFLCWNRFTQNFLKTQFLNTGVVHRLCDVLVKTQETSNQKRALKLVACLAQCQLSAKDFQNSGVAKATVMIFSSSKEPEVQIACIRALRFMWAADKHHGKLLECDAVRTVASYLNTTNSELLGKVLRALVTFTNPCTIAASQQVTGKGDGYQLIVSMVGRTVVNVLICNLSRSPMGRIELTRAGLVPEIIKQLASGKNDKYLITALCHMCQESMVRASLRNTPNGFQTFLSLISNKAAQQYHSDLLYAITYFNYDLQSLSRMIRVGLVKVIMEKLEDIVTEVGALHEATPPPTPVDQDEANQDDPLAAPSGECPKIGNVFDSIKKKRESELMGECPSQDSCILEVLLQLTYNYNPLRILALRKTVDTLLKYLTTVEMPRQEANFVRASKTLSAIVSCKHYFNDLMDEESIMSIHRELCVKRHSVCLHCDRLSETGRSILNVMSSSAESALGEGEMAHKLTSGTSAVQTTVALTIPLVIRQPHLLYNLLLVHNGLDCLIGSLDSHIDDAVPAIFTLMNTVQVPNPQKPQMFCAHPCEVNESKEAYDIVFELDDGSTVSANKEKMCNKYPMFEAMFRGGFKEAEATNVRLTGISCDCLHHMVRLASMHCHCDLPSTVGVLLEMIVTSDRFLLPSLSQAIVSHVVHNVLSHDTCSEIYTWSIHTGYKLPFSSSMAATTIKYLFTANIFFKDRVQAVSNIINSPERENFIYDLTSIIITGVKSYSVKIKSRYSLDILNIY